MQSEIFCWQSFLLAVKRGPPTGEGLKEGSNRDSRQMAVCFAAVLGS